MRVFVYSSGSVQAQRLLLEHSDAGNLVHLISGHFDTAVGPKTDPSSYSSIATMILGDEAAATAPTTTADEDGGEKNDGNDGSGQRRNNGSHRDLPSLSADRVATILFLTDNPLEAKAARIAGMSVAISVRPENEDLPEDAKLNFKTFTSFLQLFDDSFN